LRHHPIPGQKVRWKGKRKKESEETRTLTPTSRHNVTTNINKLACAHARNT